MYYSQNNSITDRERWEQFVKNAQIQHQLKVETRGILDLNMETLLSTLYEMELGMELKSKKIVHRTEQEMVENCAYNIRFWNKWKPNLETEDASVRLILQPNGSCILEKNINIFHSNAERMSTNVDDQQE